MIRSILWSAALAFALLAGSAPGERPLENPLDQASRRTVAPALVLAPPGEATWKPGTDAALLREVAQAAREIKGRLAKLPADKRTVTVGSFTCPTNTNATGGPLLRHLLTEELKKLSVKVATSGGVGVSGKYRNATDTDSGLVAAKVTFDLEDEEGEKVGKPFSHLVMSERVIADLFGATTPLSPRDSRKQRSVVLARSIRSPTVAIDGTHVSSQRGNTFGVEFLVSDALVAAGADLEALRYRPLRPTSKGGLAFVTVSPRQFYAVRLINGSSTEMAVTLSLDGLSMFTLSEATDDAGRPEQSHVLIPARSSILVKGWFLTWRKTSLFRITGFGDSVAKSKGGSVADAGTVTATFSACTKPKPKPKRDLVGDVASPSSAPSAPAATGKGPTIKFDYDSPVRRNVGAIHDTVSVRYGWATPPSAPESRPDK